MMAPGRKLQFHNPHPVPPASRRRYRPFGQDDGSDFYDGGGSDYGGDPSAGDSTTLSPLVVTAAAPAAPIDVQAQPSLLPDEPWLTPSAPLDISGLTTDLTPPVIQPGTGASNPLQNLLKSLFPPAKKSASSGGGGGGGAPAAPKLQSSPTIPKPTTTTTPATSTAETSMLWWGAGAAGLVFLAAALSGHHKRRRR